MYLSPTQWDRSQTTVLNGPRTSYSIIYRTRRKTTVILLKEHRNTMTLINISICYIVYNIYCYIHRPPNPHQRTVTCRIWELTQRPTTGQCEESERHWNAQHEMGKTQGSVWKSKPKGCKNQRQQTTSRKPCLPDTTEYKHTWTHRCCVMWRQEVIRWGVDRISVLWTEERKEESNWELLPVLWSSRFSRQYLTPCFYW